MLVLDELAAIHGRNLNDVVLKLPSGGSRRHPSPERVQYGLWFFLDRHDHRFHTAFDQVEALRDTAIREVGSAKSHNKLFHDRVRIQPFSAFAPVYFLEIGLDGLGGEQIAVMLA